MIQLAITARDNKNLFSNYYLDNQIKNNPEWKKEEHKAAFSDIKKLYDAEKDFIPTLNEKQLEQRFFAPIFKILNHTFEVNEGTEQGEFPDYAFFPDRASLDDAHKKMGNSFYDNAFAIGEVKRWGIELDRFGRDEKDRKRNPSLQIWIYLHDVSPKWGILSNGAKWRLYCKERQRDDYYEIDLPSLLATNDIENFRYFYYFFRREAYLRSIDGKIFLDEVLKGSADYAKDIGDDLKDNVYKAMKKVAEGFFSWSQNGLDIQNEATRETVQKCTMLLLYRFLFLLYAEGKGLLDLKKPQYQSYSFYKLKNEVKEKQDGPLEQRYLGVGTTLWSRLKDTFRLINQGSESFGIDKNVLNVPAYNGGLFDPQKNPELEKWVIGDTHLSEAINLLSRSRADGGKLDFVDYSTLEIRHLGSIYEGLLEYKLRVAEDEMVVNGGEWVKLEEYNKDRKQKKVFSDFNEFDRVKKGQIYLATDKGERKATGSYYTPDYIVNYIVKNTIGPVVDDKWKEAEANKKSFVDATLSVKVLDPAMGSGHFLVGSIEFLSEKLLLAVKKDIDNGRFSDESHLTSDWARREVVAHCIYGVDLNLMAVELAKVGLWLTTISKEKPLSFLDHRLKQGNSLIGARLSDLKSYPGAKKKDKDQTTLPSFISPLFITHLIGKIAEIEKIKDERLEDIKKKEKVFAEFKQLPEYRKAKALADVFTGVYFGNEVKPTENKDSANVYYDLFWAIMGDESEWRRKTNRDWFVGAEKIAQEKSFFHWELEFPELFFEGGAPKENAGWDAVVGNPPYIRIQELNKKSPDDVNYYSIKYEIASRKYDIYILFVEQSYYLCNQRSRIGFIMPVKFVNADYGRGLRNFILQKKILKELVDLSSIQVFDEVTTYTGLFIFSKDSHQQFSYWKINEMTTKLPNGKEVIIPYDSFDLDKTWVLGEKEQTSIIANIGKISTSIKLNEVVDRIFQGINSGADSVFVLRPISQSKDGKIKVFSNELGAEVELEAELLHPVLKGSEVNRYEIQEPDFLVLYLYVLDTNPHGHSQSDTRPLEESELQTRFPLTWRYISSDQTMSRLKSRKYLMNAIEGGKMGYTKWYEMWKQRRLSWMASRKILTQVLSKKNAFSLDESGKLFFVGGGTAGCNGIVMKNTELSDYFIISILNSRLANFQMKAISIKFRGDYFSTGGKGSLTDFPIRRISFTTPPARRAALVEEAKALYSAEAPDSGCPAFKCGVMDFVGARLSAAPEESDVVHDLLAHLAERMIEMNKKKNEEIKGFLRWLEGEIGAPVEELTNKTAIKEYYDPARSFEALVDALAKNKKKLKEGYDPTRREPKDKLRDEYNASVGKLAPLLKRIEATDGLIDAIVYRLYGLTEEEIRIVEGSISGKTGNSESRESA